MPAAEGIYKQLGFGILSFDSVGIDGGRITSPITHYSYGWKEKWGKRDKPVDYFTCGFIQAALAAAYYRPPRYYLVEQTHCLSMGNQQNEFEITKNSENPALPISPSTGVTIQKAQHKGRIVTNVDENAVTEAVRGIPLEGGADGWIPAFG